MRGFHQSFSLTSQVFKFQHAVLNRHSSSGKTLSLINSAEVRKLQNMARSFQHGSVNKATLKELCMSAATNINEMSGLELTKMIQSLGFLSKEVPHSLLNQNGLFEQWMKHILRCVDSLEGRHFSMCTQAMARLGPAFHKQHFHRLWLRAMQGELNSMSDKELLSVMYGLVWIKAGPVVEDAFVAEWEAAARNKMEVFNAAGISAIPEFLLVLGKKVSPTFVLEWSHAAIKLFGEMETKDFAKVLNGAARMDWKDHMDPKFIIKWCDESLLRLPRLRANALPRILLSVSHLHPNLATSSFPVFWMQSAAHHIEEFDSNYLSRIVVAFGKAELNPGKKFIKQLTDRLSKLTEVTTFELVSTLQGLSKMMFAVVPEEFLELWCVRLQRQMMELSNSQLCVVAKSLGTLKHQVSAEFMRVWCEEVKSRLDTMLFVRQMSSCMFALGRLQERQEDEQRVRFDKIVVESGLLDKWFVKAKEQVDSWRSGHLADAMYGISGFGQQWDPEFVEQWSKAAKALEGEQVSLVVYGWGKGEGSLSDEIVERVLTQCNVKEMRGLDLMYLALGLERLRPSHPLLSEVWECLALKLSDLRPWDLATLLRQMQSCSGSPIMGHALSRYALGNDLSQSEAVAVMEALGRLEISPVHFEPGFLESWTSTMLYSLPTMAPPTFMRLLSVLALPYAFSSALITSVLRHSPRYLPSDPQWSSLAPFLPLLYPLLSLEPHLPLSQLFLHSVEPSISSLSANEAVLILEIARPLRKTVVLAKYPNFFFRLSSVISPHFDSLSSQEKAALLQSVSLLSLEVRDVCGEFSLLVGQALRDENVESLLTSKDARKVLINMTAHSELVETSDLGDNAVDQKN